LNVSDPTEYLAVKPHQGAIQISDLANPGAKENLEETVLMRGEAGQE